MRDYTTYSDELLLKSFEQCNAQLLGVEFRTPKLSEKSEHESLIKGLHAQLDAIVNEQKNRKSKPSRGSKDASSSSYQHNQTFRLIDNAVNDLEKFGSGKDVANFMRDVKNVSKLAGDDSKVQQYLLNRLRPGSSKY